MTNACMATPNYLVLHIVGWKELSLPSKVCSKQLRLSILRLLENAGLWKLPTTRILLLGDKTRVKSVLLHHSLRNALHGIYFASEEVTGNTTNTQPRLGFQYPDTSRKNFLIYFLIYMVCLFIYILIFIVFYLFIFVCVCEVLNDKKKSYRPWW